MAAAPSSSTIVISDDSDDETLLHSRTGHKPLARYRAGSFMCDDIDLERVINRTGWLSGEGLAVFVQGQLEDRGITDISVVHPRTLLDVELYIAALLDGDGTAERAPIDCALAEVCIKSRFACARANMHSVGSSGNGAEVARFRTCAVAAALDAARGSLAREEDLLLRQLRARRWVCAQVGGEHPAVPAHMRRVLRRRARCRGPDLGGRTGAQSQSLNTGTKWANYSVARGRQTAGIAVRSLQAMRAVCLSLIPRVRRHKRTWVRGARQWRLGFGHLCMRLSQSNSDQGAARRRTARARGDGKGSRTCEGHSLATPGRALRRRGTPCDAEARLATPRRARTTGICG